MTVSPFSGPAGVRNAHRFSLGCGAFPAAILAVHLAISAASNAQTAVQWRAEDGGNGHWYVATYSATPLSPEAWRVSAISQGAQLASIGSQGENTAVYSVATQGGAFTQAVIGGKRNSSNVFQWMDGTPWGHTNWSSGEPSCTCEDYLMLYESGWNDTNQTPRSWAILEFDADCNNDGIVDYGQILDGLFDDANDNGIPDCCDEGLPCSSCAGDIVPDAVVDGTDLAALLNRWGSAGGGSFNADLNNSGLVDGADLTILLLHWGACS